MFGEIPGIEVGRHFKDRREVHDNNVHRGLMRGISPQGASIVMSGGYVDDVDLGDIIIYTGEGGNDPNTKRQVADQTLTGGNPYLMNMEKNEGPRAQRNTGSSIVLMMPMILSSFLNGTVWKTPVPLLKQRT